ncbi:sensor histidine kinase [Gaoshiqia sp. Z1-71]|uniref:sensor histidine kinase n=1 Tax=Gaoshiqia hydrogeniformans TaxID=3290090 RepID=UPI003BF7AFB7
MKNQLADLFNRLVTSADTNPYSAIEERKKSILLNLFFYFYFLVVGSFLVWNVITSNPVYLFANAAGLFVGIILFYIFRVKKRLVIVSAVFVVTIALFSTFLLQTGGIENSALVFALLIPLPTILILGKRWGLIVLMVFILINLAGFIFFYNTMWFPHYSMHMISRTGIVFVLISVMAYSNEYVFETLYLRLEKLSESLKVSQQRYKNLAVNKERFVSLISNNLGDHIGSFAAIANLLNEEYHELTEEKRLELIRNLANISQQNYKLLYDLVKWSTSQSETIPYVPKPIKLEKIYRDIVALFHPMIEEKKLSFFLKMRSNSEIYADEDMLGAILRSLVSNAIKFSHVGGEVRISAVEEDDMMAVTVADTGVGMSRQSLMRVNAAVSFSTPGTMKEPGTGIGLILVREFLQKNRGYFHVESQKGKGTQVTFRLPLVE